LIHEKIQELAKICLERYGKSTEGAMLFPSRKVAESARSFMMENNTTLDHQPHIVQLSFPPVTPSKSGISTPSSAVHLFVLLYSPEAKALAKAFWQHTGYGISSRMAEYCLLQLESVARLDEADVAALNGWNKPLRRTPYKNRHYAKDINFSKLTPTSPTKEKVPSTEELTQDQMLYLEERYGRNLDISFAGRAKIALRRRIAGTLRENVDINEALLKEAGDNVRTRKGLDESDVWLCPTGMAAIWTAHQLLLTSFPPQKAVCFGYVMAPPC
jgi:cystathionine gamma-synthase